MTHAELISTVAGHLHAGQMVDGARVMASFSGANAHSVDSRDVALEWCNSLLYACLNRNQYADAAALLWTPNFFTPEPRATRMVWDGIQRSPSLMLMGAASQSKSYSAGVWLMLDWIRDPEYTSVNLVGPSENHLKDNLFSHLVAMHNNASLPLPGFTGDLFIGLDSKNRKSSITGIVIPLGKRPSGRLQGRKRIPRRTVHPTLGKLSRIRFMLDEVEKIPIGVYKDIDNILSNFDGDVDAFKLILAFNPEDPTGPAAQRCEPLGGWEGFNMETDHEWKSKRGWDVVRLDAAKSENVIQKKLIFPGLQSYEGYQRIISNAGGINTPGYFTMARACFPQTGAIFSVMPSVLVGRMRGEYMFAETPENFAGADLALEGSDVAAMALGRFGRAVGVRYPANFQHPAGRELLFADKTGKRVFRYALQIDQVFPLVKGSTVPMAENIHKQCVMLKVPPGNLMVDRTGNGAGVHDYLKSFWSEEVMGLAYMENASDTKILQEDTKTAIEEYKRAVSELWFALKKWAEFNFVKMKPEALTEEIALQFTGRRYATGKLNAVETKDEYKSRGNQSPNDADAITLLLAAVRKATKCIPSVADDLEGTVTTIFTDRSNAPVPQLTDVTTVPESLESYEQNDYMN